MSNRGFNAELLDGPPPHDLEAEAGVVGSVLLDPRTLDLVGQIIRPIDFHDDRNRILFGHLLAMRNDGTPIDVLLLKVRMKRAGQWVDDNGESAAHLTEIISGVPVAAHAVYYAKIVREKAKLRAVINVCLDVTRRAYDVTTDYAELIKELRGLVDEMRQDR